MENTSVATNQPQHEIVPVKEKLSFAFTNTGQTLVYGLFGMLMLYMTDYLGIDAAIAGLIIALTRIFDAVNDPIMGQIVDRTKTRWGKCRPYMLFTPIPVALAAIAMFAPIGLTSSKAIPYAVIIYLLFTMIYTANDIPYWSMSSVITTDPKQRVSIVTLTRLIGSIGTGLSVGAFWLVNKLFVDYAGASKHNGFFFSAIVFCVVGAALMMQGFFNTKERTVCKPQNEKFFDNIKLIPKSKPLVINLVAGALYSVMAVGMTALTTYFIKWNVQSIYPNMPSVDVMSKFTPLIGFLPAAATIVGLLTTPFFIKKFEKKNILIAFCSFGAIVNVISFFVGYESLWLFIILRFFAFLPVGVWTSMTTILIGDSVDYIEYKTGKRVEGTCFSLLTFMGKFQNSISVAITGFILSVVGYNGDLNPNIQNQTPLTLQGIFIMVTLVSALGYVLAMIPFFFYKLDKKTHLLMVDENLRRKSVLEAKEEQQAILEQ